MQTPIFEDEKLIKKGMASLQKGLETVGGHLYLTNNRLIFESHSFNIQTGVTQVELNEIMGMRKGTTMFLGILPTVPNAFVVTTEDGSEYRFTVWKRKLWMAAIKQAQA
jgi:hypothetical protein